MALALGAKIGIGVGSLVVVVGGVGGGVAFAKLHSSDDYPYSHLAQGAVAYVQENVDPSAGQKLALNSLANKFNDVADGRIHTIVRSDNVNAALIKALASGDEAKQDWTWVGDRTALALYPGKSGGDPVVAIAIQTGDTGAAEKAVGKLVDSLNQGTPGGATLKGRVKGDLVEITDGSFADVFDTSHTLADSTVFTDRFDTVQGDVLGAWSDVDGLTRASASLAAEDPSAKAGLGALTAAKVSGYVTGGVKARKDGLDLVVSAHGVTAAAKASTSTVDPAAVAAFATQNSYARAIATLGWGVDPATLAQDSGSLLDQPGSSASGGQGSSPLAGLTGQQLSALIGTEGAFSVEGSTGGGSLPVDLSLALDGVSPEAWQQTLTGMGLSFPALQGLLAQELPGSSLSLSGSTLHFVLGAAPQGGTALEDGQLTGRLDVDGIASLLQGLGKAAPGSVPKRLGTVTLHSRSTGKGDGELALSWTTPR